MTHVQVPPPVQQARAERRTVTFGRWALILGGVVAIAAALWMGYMAGRYQDERDAAKQEAQSEGQLKDALERERLELAEEQLALCRGDDAAARKMRSAGLCRRAKEIQETDPVDLIVPIELVRQAVREELAANPPAAGRSPTAEDILPAVRREVSRWLSNNPPEDGRDGSTPSDARLLALIRQVYAENPPADGRDGTDGVDGQDGADGADGVDGPRGDSAIGHRFERVDGDCRSVMTFERADGSTYERDSDAGEAACAPDPPNEPGG